MPGINELKRLSQALTMLDAIIERNRASRYYSFNSRWSTDEQLASMRNGEGDEWFCVFSIHGAFLKGLYHESEMARGWPGLLDSVLEDFKSALAEPAFSMQYTSFKPTTYQQWAEEYYRRPVSLSAIDHIYAQKPLTDEIVCILDPTVDLPSLATDIAEIGYPTAVIATRPDAQ